MFNKIQASTAEKRCCCCGGEKLLTEFTFNRRQPDGRDATCRTCNADRIRRKKARYVASFLCADCGAKRSSANNLYCDRCAASRSVGKQQRYESLRRAVLDRYSNGALRCACCGEAQFDFLTLDHMNNDGKHHRRQCGTVQGVYRDLVAREFPAGMRVLCFNCNIGRAASGVCPHVSGAVVVAPIDQFRRVNDLSDPGRLRLCTGCKQWVPRATYYADRGGPEGLQSRCGGCTRAAALDRLHRIRDEAFAHYGGGNVRCICCGESTPAFLALDYINGGGTAARRIAGAGGNVHYVWLKKQGFPPGLQIMCHNCNCAKRDRAVCPHSRG